MANLLHCFHSVVMSLSSARFIPVTSWVSAHLSGGSLVRGSLVRGSLVRGFQGSLVRGSLDRVQLSGVHLSGGSLVRGFRGHLSGGLLVRGFTCSGFTCPYFSSAITFWFLSAIPRVRHFQSAPLDSISEHFASRTAAHRYTTQQGSNAIHFAAGQHRYHSAGQQRNTNHATLNRNLTEIKIPGTEENAGEISPQYSSRTASPMYISAEQHRPCIYFSRTASPWKWRPQTDIEFLSLIQFLFQQGQS